MNSEHSMSYRLKITLVGLEPPAQVLVPGDAAVAIKERHG